MIFSLLVLKKYKDQNKYCSKFYYVTERTKMIYNACSMRIVENNSKFEDVCVIHMSKH